MYSGRTYVQTKTACVKLQQRGAVQTIHKNAQEFGIVPFFLLYVRKNQLGTGSKVDRPKLTIIVIGQGYLTYRDTLSTDH